MERLYSKKVIIYFCLTIGVFLLNPMAKAQIPDKLNFAGVTYITKGLNKYGGGTSFHVEYLPGGENFSDVAFSLEFSRSPYLYDHLDDMIAEKIKFLENWKPKGTLTVLKKSESTLILKDVRYNGTITGKPFFILIIAELEGHTLLISQFIFKPRGKYSLPDAFKEEFISKEASWLAHLIRLSRIIQQEIFFEFKKDNESIDR